MRETTKILRAIMQDPKASDRTLGKIAGVSQPTITRHRHRLTTTGIISYEIVPDLKQLGYEIFAVTIFKNEPPKNDNVVYKAKVPGGIMVFSVHKIYSDYAKFIEDRHDILATHLVNEKPTKTLSFKNIPF